MNILNYTYPQVEASTSHVCKAIAPAPRNVSERRKHCSYLFARPCNDSYAIPYRQQAYGSLYSSCSFRCVICMLHQAWENRGILIRISIFFFFGGGGGGGGGGCIITYHLILCPLRRSPYTMKGVVPQQRIHVYCPPPCTSWTKFSAAGCWRAHLQRYS